MKKKNLFKKPFSAILGVTVSLGMIASFGVLPTAAAQTSFSGGMGTRADPYLITTLEQLSSIRDLDGKFYRLENDLDIYQWKPLGTPDNPVVGGGFDGNGYTLRSMKVSDVDYGGLFGYTERLSVINLNLDTVSVVADEVAGAVVARSSGGSIKNCFVTGAVQAPLYSGGIVGEANGTVIQGCYTNVSPGSAGARGGISGTGGNISDSYFSTDLSGQSVGLVSKEQKAADFDTAQGGLSTAALKSDNFALRLNSSKLASATEWARNDPDSFPTQKTSRPLTSYQNNDSTDIAVLSNTDLAAVVPNMTQYAPTGAVSGDYRPPTQPLRNPPDVDTTNPAFVLDSGSAAQVWVTETNNGFLVAEGAAPGSGVLRDSNGNVLVRDMNSITDYSINYRLYSVDRMASRQWTYNKSNNGGSGTHTENNAVVALNAFSNNGSDLLNFVNGAHVMNNSPTRHSVTRDFMDDDIAPIYIQLPIAKMLNPGDIRIVAADTNMQSDAFNIITYPGLSSNQTVVELTLRGEYERYLTQKYYTFKVEVGGRILNLAGNIGPYTLTLEINDMQAGILTATATDTQAALRWTAPSESVVGQKWTYSIFLKDGDRYYDMYTSQQLQNLMSTTDKKKDVDILTDYVLTGLSPGRQYTINILAKSPDTGYVAYTPQVIWTTASNRVTAANITTASADLSWTPQASGSWNYFLYMSKNDITKPDANLDAAGNFYQPLGSVVNFRWGNLEPGVKYYFNVKAVDAMTGVPIVYQGTDVQVKQIGTLTAPTITTNPTDFTKLTANSTALVTMTHTNDPVNSSIYYTLDGRAPDKTSTRYTGPFNITSNKMQGEKVVINAVVVQDGTPNSTVTKIELTFGSSSLLPIDGKTIDIYEHNWSEISAALEASDKGSVRVMLDQNTTVFPKSAMSALRGKDIELTVDMGTYSWTMNGKDVRTARDSLDMGLIYGNDVSLVSGSYLAKLQEVDYTDLFQMSLNADGAFPFDAKLTLYFGKNNANLFANMYYVNNSLKRLDYMESAKIDKDGVGKFNMNHASSYVIVVSDQQLTNLSSFAFIDDFVEPIRSLPPIVPICVAALGGGILLMVIVRRVTKD